MKNKSRKKMGPDNHFDSKHKLLQKRQLSLSSAKVLNKLSLSFYDDSTLRKNKQFILDSPVQYGYNLGLNRTQYSNNQKHARSPGRKSKGATIDCLPMGKQRDEIDFTTTEASKINLLEQKLDQRQINKRSKGRQLQSVSKQKKSMQKYKKQIFMQMMQQRSKTSKGIFDKKQPHLIRKN